VSGGIRVETKQGASNLPNQEAINVSAKSQHKKKEVRGGNLRRKRSAAQQRKKAWRSTLEGASESAGGKEKRARYLNTREPAKKTAATRES